MKIYNRLFLLSLLSLFLLNSGLFAADIVLSDLPDKDGMNLKGYVHDGTKGLPNILVTDGYSFTRTDANGVYYLAANASANFVFVVTPAGYNAECTNGITQFYKWIPNKNNVFQANFKLSNIGDDTHHKFLVLGDPQMKDDHDYNLFETKALPDIKKSIAEIKEEGLNPHMLVLGDICFNTWGTYPRYVKYWEGINASLYHCPGNHDKHITTFKAMATREYCASFGPLYYSFNKGKVHYLMLDNIKIVKTDSTAATGLYDECMAWVEKDLSYVPHGSSVVVCGHQPFTWTQASCKGLDGLLKLLCNYKTMILSAHKHYGKSLGSLYNSNVEERIQTTLCGAYWYGDVAKDGDPLGYYIYEAKGDSLSWRFKQLGHSVDDVMTIYPPAPTADNGYSFDVNIFDYDSHWNVSWRKDGVEQQRIYSINAYDPLAYILYINYPKTWVRPVVNDHMFKLTVPPETSSIEIYGKDRFGNPFSSTYQIKASGILNITDSHIRIYPNPTSDVLHVDTDKEIHKLILMDIQGTVRMVSTDCVLNVSSLSSGCYYLQILYENGDVAINKIMKK